MAKKKKSFMTPKASRRKARKKRTTVTGRKKKEFTYRGYEVEELKAKQHANRQRKLLDAITAQREALEIDKLTYVLGQTGKPIAD